MGDIVTIICYGKRSQMARDEAIAFYSEAIAACDGSEKDRYMNIFLGLVMGLTVCTDGEVF